MIIEGRIAERRQITRGNSDREPRRSHVVDTILGSFTEMPGLCLTIEQAARLFNLKIESCEIILEDLVREARGSHSARLTAPRPSRQSEPRSVLCTRRLTAV